MIVTSIGDLLITTQVLAVSIVVVILAIGGLLAVLEWVATDDNV